MEKHQNSGCFLQSGDGDWLSTRGPVWAGGNALDLDVTQFLYTVDAVVKTRQMYTLGLLAAWISLQKRSWRAQWLGLHASTAAGIGSNPGQGTKIPWATTWGQKKKAGNKYEFCLLVCKLKCLGKYSDVCNYEMHQKIRCVGKWYKPRQMLIAGSG